MAGLLLAAKMRLCRSGDHSMAVACAGGKGALGKKSPGSKAHRENTS